MVTGAGSGVGRAVALLMAANRWRVALVGRHGATLRQTMSLAGPAADGFLVCACDIADAAGVQRMARRVLAEFGHLDVLVNSAGTNTPRRSLELLTLAKYHEIVGANLNGAFQCLQAFLPGMRRRRSGMIVNIVSDSARQASPKAGAAYVASKFGLLGLTQSINAEERVHGIRACAILPGDIDTPLLEKRPNPPSLEARQTMLQADDVAQCAWLAISLPPRAVVEEILIRPR